MTKEVIESDLKIVLGDDGTVRVYEMILTPYYNKFGTLSEREEDVFRTSFQFDNPLTIEHQNYVNLLK